MEKKLENRWKPVLAEQLGREPSQAELDAFMERLASAWYGVPEPRHSPRKTTTDWTTGMRMDLSEWSGQ